jgi:hypothetical protein
MWVKTGKKAGGWGSAGAFVAPNTIGCTLPKMAANATPSEISEIGVAQGVNSLILAKFFSSPMGGEGEDVTSH